MSWFGSDSEAKLTCDDQTSPDQPVFPLLNGSNSQW